MGAKQPKPYTETQVRRGNAVIKRMSRINTWLYTKTNGRLGGKFLRGAPVCLLTTTGRSSGEPRTSPLLYLFDGDDIILVASKGGFPGNPQWYLNLLADPAATIQIGPKIHSVIAHEATASDKDALWPKLTAMYKDFETYRSRTDRDIPILRCVPAPR